MNLAALLMGKTPVNLNYTASSEILASCASQCGLETIISSKVFLERVRLQLPGRVILMEDWCRLPGLSERLLGGGDVVDVAGAASRASARIQQEARNWTMLLPSSSPVAARVFPKECYSRTPISRRMSSS